MEALPLLILDTVCDYLIDMEPIRASLLSFALTSKTCRAVAARQLFSSIKLSSRLGPFPHRLVGLEEVLDRSSARRFVRTLRVGCATSGSFRTGGYRDEEAFWAPFVRFLSSLAALRDLVWEDLGQIPRCVLSALREQLPSCRLRVEYLSLPSPHEKQACQEVLHKSYKLATLPNLNSIRVPHTKSEWRNYKGDAVLQMVAGLAEGLRHVSLWENGSDGWEETGPWHGTYSVPDWVRLLPAGSKGELHSLAIKAGVVTGSHISTWEANTDFSVLRSLTLSRVDLSALQVLATLAEENNFLCLTDLDLAAKRTRSEEREEAESTLTRLLFSLSPLENLALVAIGEASYNAALTTHGSTLHLLRVKETILSSQGIALLVHSCPLLRTLDIEILRSAGDRVETAVYRSLGTLRSLESLSLGLHCLAHQFEARPRLSESEIKTVLANAALDAQLALSIAQTISTAHPPSFATHNLPPKLRSITLRVLPIYSKSSYRISKSFLQLLELIGRGWECSFDPRDTHQGAMFIEELPETVRARMKWNVTQWVERLVWSDIKREKTMVLKAWKALWPATGAYWMDGWRGFPLATGTGIDDSVYDLDGSRYIVSPLPRR